MSKDRHELDTSEIEIQTSFNNDDISILVESGAVENEDKNDETEE